MSEGANPQERLFEDHARLQFLYAVDDFEQDLARRGGTPDRDRLIHIRLRPLLEVSGAVLLALNAAAVSLFGNFLVFNKILHWSF